MHCNVHPQGSVHTCPLGDLRPLKRGFKTLSDLKLDGETEYFWRPADEHRAWELCVLLRESDSKPGLAVVQVDMNSVSNAQGKHGRGSHGGGGGGDSLSSSHGGGGKSRSSHGRGHGHGHGSRSEGRRSGHRGSGSSSSHHHHHKDHKEHKPEYKLHTASPKEMLEILVDDRLSTLEEVKWKSLQVLTPRL